MGFARKVARRILRGGKTAVHAVRKGIHAARPYVARALQRADSLKAGLAHLGISAASVGAGVASGSPTAAVGGVLSGIKAGKRIYHDVKHIVKGGGSAPKRRKVEKPPTHANQTGAGSTSSSSQPKMSADAVSRLSHL